MRKINPNFAFVNFVAKGTKVDNKGIITTILISDKQKKNLTTLILLLLLPPPPPLLHRHHHHRLVIIIGGRRTNTPLPPPAVTGVKTHRQEIVSKSVQRFGASAEQFPRRHYPRWARTAIWRQPERFADHGYAKWKSTGPGNEGVKQAGMRY